mmetsp:Transcript_87059/g.173888  ORF Transcript_87059/g.173888 Transcript_87059/m.173888 type:complete len:286 (+) Transcript_87059:48-905(+)
MSFTIQHRTGRLRTPRLLLQSSRARSSSTVTGQWGEEVLARTRKRSWTRRRRWRGRRSRRRDGPPRSASLLLVGRLRSSLDWASFLRHQRSGWAKGPHRQDGARCERARHRWWGLRPGLAPEVAPLPSHVALRRGQARPSRSPRHHSHAVPLQASAVQPPHLQPPPGHTPRPLRCPPEPPQTAWTSAGTPAAGRTLFLTTLCHLCGPTTAHVLTRRPSPSARLAAPPRPPRHAAPRCPPAARRHPAAAPRPLPRAAYPPQAVLVMSHPAGPPPCHHQPHRAAAHP